MAPTFQYTAAAQTANDATRSAFTCWLYLTAVARVVLKKTDCSVSYLFVYFSFP